MWATDAGGWQQILAASVDTYDARGLEERWRIYAWPGIADGAHRDLAALGMDPSNAFAIEPIPAPHTMFEHVTHALSAERDDPGANAIDHAVDAALPNDPDLDWPTSPAVESGPGSPAPDASTGAEP
ncbi:hypothetical protein GFY24_33035 [Nocardia sp. SYP-A9097]|uniref:hypothetical protein n=1 Tax=Nocardia sp. SYP-A9097 TaxID=2663237 RepID=UPI00129B7323|nr:hypothetical protein [Nocardia sp. SYP-A9097]MRH92205.1 hypothetical protein [Nocardia sp. SYP-A9097]